MNDVDLWFIEQILPHERALNRYLRRVWPDAAEIADLRQEVYVRVYDAAISKKPPVARYFLFSVARNLLTDRLRHSRVVPIVFMGDLSSLHVLSNEVTIERALSGRQELARLEAALKELPPRCRETFILRKVEEYSQREVAAMMGVAEGTVEKQLIKAMRFLTHHFWNGNEEAVTTPLGNELDGHADQRG